MHRALEPDTWFWSNTDELLALVAELLDHGNQLFAAAHSKKGTKMSPPLRVPRPRRSFESGERPKPATTEDMKRVFEGMVKYG